MNKKKIIILITTILVILATFISILLINKKENQKPTFDNIITSVITIDINPSIKIELNKDNLVVNITALNEDAKELIKDNNKGKTLNEVINTITSNIKDKEYAKEELVVLVNATGKISSQDVKNIMDNNLNNEKITHNIIIPTITKTSKEIAQKYNITESKASYIEEIITNNPDIKVEDIIDLNIKEITKTNEETPSTKTPVTKPQTPTPSKNVCESTTPALTNEEAAKKIASLMGATVKTGSYCDILSPESVMVNLNNTCLYKVSISYRTNNCTYYVDVKTGNILSNPTCTPKTITEGENQCIIMQEMNLTKREMFYYKAVDNGTEFISTVEDVYGTPDSEGKRYVYEYHVSKQTGKITQKQKLHELQ